MDFPAPLVFAALASWACVGNIDASADPPSRESGPTARPAGSDASRGSPSPSTNMMAAATPATGCASPLDPGASPLRPLTRSEYQRTILDLTGIDLGSLVGLAPQAALAGFDTDRETFALSAVQMQLFLEGAEATAQAIIASPERRARALGCEPVGTASAECMRRFVTSFGRRAFRRSLQPDEISALLTLAQTARDDPDPYAGAGLVIRGLLQSPKFILHVESGTADSAGGRRRLTGAERASRLSYLLLGTTPDDALLSSAEAGGLDDAEKVAAAAGRMLAAPRARPHLRSFFSRWFGLDALAGVTRDPKAYPLWNESLRTSMQSETLALIEDFAWTPGRSFIDLLGARRTFVDAGLARLYGLPAPVSGFHEVSLDGTPRTGLLTQASLLTATAGGDATPIRRGKFIREVLLCQTPPDPPNDVPDLPAPRAGQSQRQRLELHRTAPACAGCHALLDPLGFGLARFDDIGAYRSTDAAGTTISDEGALVDAPPDARAFRGPAELASRLAATGAFPGCVAAKVMEYGLGRPPGEAQSCLRKPIEDAFAQRGHDFAAALLALVKSDAFLFRRAPEALAAAGRP